MERTNDKTTTYNYLVKIDPNNIGSEIIRWNGISKKQGSLIKI